MLNTWRDHHHSPICTAFSTAFFWVSMINKKNSRREKRRKQGQGMGGEGGHGEGKRLLAGSHLAAGPDLVIGSKLK